MPKLVLKAPITPFTISQLFGNPDPKYLELNLPGHNGIDLIANHGQPVYASHDGRAYYEVDSHQGHGVVIITDEQFEYRGKLSYFKSIYWHLVNPAKDTRYVSPIQGFTIGKPKKVKAGDLIGYSDNTGYSTGSHLHFGLKPCTKNGSYTEKNAYAGAIDPLPYLSTTPYFFYRNLEKGMSGNDVYALQVFLNLNGFTIAIEGPGSPGKETYLFGGLTCEALKRFQKEKCINPQSGYFGPMTKALVNKILIE